MTHAVVPYLVKYQGMTLDEATKAEESEHCTTMFQKLVGADITYELKPKAAEVAGPSRCGSPAIRGTVLRPRRFWISKGYAAQIVLSGVHRSFGSCLCQLAVHGSKPPPAGTGAGVSYRLPEGGRG